MKQIIISLILTFVSGIWVSPTHATPLNISPRSSWSNTQDDQYVQDNWPVTNSEVFPVERIIIHDTGMKELNSDSLDPRQTIRGIFNTHAKRNGWGDIGYNYIIARDGQVFQGRMGGNGTRGAHLYVNRTGDNFNFGSIGIVLIGRYGSGYAKAPMPMQESLARLVGFLSSTNGFDPWEYFSGRIKNFYTQDYTSWFSGYRVVDHGNVEPGNGDHNMVDMSWLRSRAQTWKWIFDQSTYQAPNGRLFRITNGTKTPVSMVTTSQVLPLSQSQIDLFPDSSRIRNLPNGTLVRNSRGVGFLSGGSIRAIVNPHVFISRFQWKDVVDISDREWSQYAQGNLMTLREGMLVREQSRPEVYIISDSQKSWIKSSDIMSAMGFSWNNLTVVADGTLSIHGNGPDITPAKYPNGVLMVNRDNPTSGVYVLQNGVKRPIPSPEIFDTQFRWTDLVYVSASVFDSYGFGSPVFFPDGTLIREVNGNQVFIMSDGKKRPIISAQVFEDLGYKWSNIRIVSDGSTEAIPWGPALMNSDIQH